MSIVPNALSAHQLLSVNVINQYFADKQSIYMQTGQATQIVQLPKITSIVNIESWLKPQYENVHIEHFVLVGQTINISVLEKIFKSEFHLTEAMLVTSHHLHLAFNQQAVIVTLVHKQANKILNSQALLQLSNDYYVDAFPLSKVSLSKPGLLLMDMDSTIINMECIDEIAALVGVGAKVADLTERAMQGELDFNQSLRARVDCLSGIQVAELEKIKSRLPVNPGFSETIKFLQKHGWITCIASGGFTYFANYLQQTFELNDAISNTLAIEGDCLTGKVEGDIVNGEMKREILIQKAKKHQIEALQTIAIGDGANDLLMMGEAALGVAYKAKIKVKKAADANIQYCGFEGLLYCLAQ